jgi:hypothetical protein
MNPNSPVQEPEAVFRRLVEPVTVAGREVNPKLWLLVLVPVLVLALAYVAWMYARDSRSVRWYFAAPLALLRATVYLLLAVVFLLPAMQYWETTEKRSRVLMLIDVSPSVGTVSDDLPDPAAPSAKLVTRLDKLTKYLADTRAGLVKRLAEKNPVTVFRFGDGLDPEPFTFTAETPAWSAEEWDSWLRLDLKPWVLTGLSPEGRAKVEQSAAFEPGTPGTPEWATRWRRLETADAMPADLSEADKAKLAENRGKLDARVDAVKKVLGGTNLGGSLLTLLNREANTMVQGVVVVSDGRSNLGSDAEANDARARAKAEKVPVFAVQVGEDRPRTSIVITDVQSPEMTPPDERFPVAVEVDGSGLPNEDITVSLDLYPPKSDKPAHTMEVPAKFQPGEPPHAQARFELDPAKLPDGLLKAESKGGQRELIEGEWKLRARVPRDRREVFAQKEHVSDPVSVRVVKRPLRVLLVAGGPMRDYQFLRSLLVREDKERAELSVFLQNEGRDGRAVQDVEANRLLNRFPDLLRADDDPLPDPKDRYYDLGQYDLVLAFDPDWSELTEQQVKNLHDWVQYRGGGLIVVAGPVNTYQLASADEGGKFKPLLDLFPVKPGDSRLQNPLTGSRRNTREAYRLNFPGAHPEETDFLKLDDDKPGVLAGWEEFFTGQEKPEANPPAKVPRGFFTFYPVQSVKRNATVVATFGDPSARDAEGKEPPFLVTLKYDKGMVAWVGSAETYRLRQFRETFYERFWTKLGRRVSSGTRRVQTTRGVPVVGRLYTVGSYVTLKAQLFGPDSKPLPPSERPKLTLVPPGADGPRGTRTLEMRDSPSAAEWAGYFQQRFQVTVPGEWRWEVAIPRSSESLKGKFTVQEANPELDNTRPDPAALVRVSGEVGELPRLESGDAEQLRSRLRAMAPGGTLAKPAPGDDGDALRLYFGDLSSASLIPGCVEAKRTLQRNRGKVEDLWDKGIDEVNLPGGLKWVSDGLHAVGDRVPSLKGKPVLLPVAFLAVVALLSVEWLCRKLLKLA